MNLPIIQLIMEPRSLLSFLAVTRPPFQLQQATMNIIRCMRRLDLYITMSGVPTEMPLLFLAFWRYLKVRCRPFQ